MNFHDPNRPRLASDIPQFLWGQALQEPSLRSLPDGGWEISLMLGSGTSHWHSTIVKDDGDLLYWLGQWRDDPEAFVRRCWPDFEPSRKRVAPKAQGKKELSLDDIF